jgi:multiple sugar transport system permease protein
MIASAVRKLAGKKSAGGWLITLAMYGLALSWLYPFVWMVMASLKPTPEIYTTGLLGGRLSLANYDFLFSSVTKLHRPFLGALGVSFGVTIAVTVSVLVKHRRLSPTPWHESRFRSESISEISCYADGRPNHDVYIAPMFVLIKQLGLIIHIAL